jgi:hypothetical protein
MPTPNQGTFQAKNSISFSQIASEFNQVDDGTREIKFSDYYLNNGILSSTIIPVSYEDFTGSTAPTISNALVLSEFDNTGVSETSDISGTGMSSATWTTIGNVTGLKVAKMYKSGTGTTRNTNDLVPTSLFISNDTGYHVDFQGSVGGEGPLTTTIVPDFHQPSIYHDGQWPQSTAYGNRPNNWYNETQDIPTYIVSPIGGTDNWTAEYSPPDNNQVQYCNYLYANGTTAGGCGITDSAVSGMSGSQITLYTTQFSHGVLGASVKKIYNYLYPSTSGELKLSKCYMLKNDRKTIDGVATATATGVIV